MNFFAAASSVVRVVVIELALGLAECVGSVLQL
jgi:hypothetical protein